MPLHSLLQHPQLSLVSAGLLLGGGENLGCHALVHTVVQFIVPNLTTDTWLSLNSFLASIVVCQRTRAGLDAILADLGHWVNWVVVLQTKSRKTNENEHSHKARKSKTRPTGQHSNPNELPVVMTSTVP